MFRWANLYITGTIELSVVGKVYGRVLIEDQKGYRQCYM